MFDKSRLCISAGLKDPAVGQTDVFCVFPTVATPEIFIGGSCYGENIVRSVVNILSVIVKIIEYLLIRDLEMRRRCAYAYRGRDQPCDMGVVHGDRHHERSDMRAQ